MVPDPRPPSASPTLLLRLRRGFWLLFFAFFAATVALIGREHWERHEAAVAHLGEKASLIARALDDSASHAFRHADESLRAAARARGPEDLDAALAAHRESFPHLFALAVHDADGRLIAAAGETSPADAGQQAFFRAHRDRPEENLRVERIEGPARFRVSRRIVGPAGAFAGVAAGVLALDPVFALRRDAGKADDTAFALLSPDGALLAHDPPARIGAARLGLAGATGVGRGPWPFDDNARIHAWRTLTVAPVVVVVGLATERIANETWQEIAVEGAVLGAFLAILLAGGLLMLRAVRRLNEARALHGALDERLNLIADIIPVRVSITRAGDRRVLWANRRWLDYYGLTDSNIGTFSIRDSYVDPAAHDRLIAELDAKGSVADFLAEIRDKAGGARWLALSARKIRYDDQDAIIVASVDITSLRRAEEAERRALREMAGVVNGVVEGLIGIDAQGVIRVFNPAAEKIFGYAAAEAIGRNVSVLMPSPFAQEHDGYIANYLRTGAAKIIGKPREVIGRRKDGSLFPMALAVNDVRAEDVAAASDPARVRFIGAVRDITRRKQAEADLLVAKSQAEIANRAKSDFLAHVSHELRTPLNAILGFADMIRARALGTDALDRYAEYGHHIYGSGQVLLKTIDGLIAMSTAEAGRHVLAEETLPLAVLLEPVLDSLKPVAQGLGVELAAEVPPGLPALRVDAQAVRQVFANVLSNALKFTPRDGRVALSATIEESGALAVAVADTGPGIARERLARILEPFSRDDAYVARPNEGLGVGLAVCRSFMELHGGTLEIQSAEGQGTVVIARFPAARLAGL